MKNILQLICIGFILLAVSCNKDQSDEVNPLLFMTCKGDKTLTVKATYNGSVPTATVGSKKIYVYLFKKLGLTSRDPVYQGSTDAAVTPGVEATITISEICTGDYYVVVFYDYRSGDNPDNQTDRYIIYNSGTDNGFTASATKVTIDEDHPAVELNGITFNDTFKLQSSSRYMSPCTLTVNATYSGDLYTANPGTQGSGRLFVHLYDAKGTDTRTPEPIYTGSTDSPATSGTITITNIAAGNYYVLLFYDYNDDSSGEFDSEDDRYILYNGTPYMVSAQELQFSDGGSQSWTASFGNDYILDSGSAYRTPPPADLTVNVTYNGAPYTDDTGTGQIFVYLYNAEGWDAQTPYGTRLPETPDYTATTAGPATIGSEATITFSSIPQWEYYIVVFYDYRDSESDSASVVTDDSYQDRYIIYSSGGNVGIPGSATAYSLTGNQTLDLPDFGNDYTFQTNVLWDALFMQSGSLTVNATYNGTAGAGSGKIYVYLYESRPTASRTPLPIYSGSTAGAVTLNTEDTITLSNIAAGNYFVLIFYDYASGTNPDNRYDRYELYDNTGSSAGASALSISGATVLDDIYFDDSTQIGSGGSLQP